MIHSRNISFKSIHEKIDYRPRLKHSNLWYSGSGIWDWHNGDEFTHCVEQLVKDKIQKELLLIYTYCHKIIYKMKCIIKKELKNELDR